MSHSSLLQLLLIGAVFGALPLAWVWFRADSGRYRKLVWVTMFLTFDLIMFGAFTRLTDSGLGCPDWPGCYGHSNPVAAATHIDAAQTAMPTGPVTTAKAWIEMLHRYFAMAVGLLIVVGMVAAWRHRRAYARSPWPATALFVLVCVQGAFGAWTVTLKLMPAVVTIHLLLGVTLLCALAWVAERATAGMPQPGTGGGLRAHAALALAVVFAQIALGGWVSTNYAVMACQDFPLCNGAWLPEADFGRGFDIARPLGQTADGQLLPFSALVAIHWTHRAFALLVLVLVGTLAWRCAAQPAQAGYARLARLLAALLVWQIATGISNIVFSWPLAVAVVHNGGAAGLALVATLALSRMTGRAPAPNGGAP